LPVFETSQSGVLSVTKEQKYYKYLFEQHYPLSSNIVPYYWMPKYVNATDASARTLDLYNEAQTTEKRELDACA
jgi:hypothetical protein